MIIYVSMLAVVVMGYLLHKVRIKNLNIGSKYRVSKSAVFLVFGYIIFWVGMRNSFVDTGVYISKFNSATAINIASLDFRFGSGWGFDIIEALFKTFISQNYHMWLMFLAIVTGACIAVTFYRYAYNFYYTMFLFVTATTFTWMMNGIRQFLVVAILFACTPLIEKRKWFTYCVIVLFCSTIHASCIIMIPLYFIVQAKPWERRTILLLIGVLLVLTFSSRFTNILDLMLSETKYGNVSEKFIGDDGVNPLRVLVYSVTPILAFFGRKIMSKEDRIVNVFVNMSIITACLYAVGVVTSGILIGRLPIYTQMYEYMLLPYVIDRCFTPDSRRILYLGSIVGFLIYFYLMTQGIYYSSEFTGRIY